LHEIKLIVCLACTHPRHGGGDGGIIRKSKNYKATQGT